MSFDIGVWYSDAPVTQQEAAAFYQHINQDWVVVRRHREFDAFWDQLLSRFPDLRPLGAPPANPDEPPLSMLITMDEIRAAPVTMPKAKPLPESQPEEDSPWAATLAPSGSAVSLPIVWSRVEEVAPIIREFAARYGLVFYDPQSGEVALPPALQGRAAASEPKPLLTLRIDGRLPILRVRISIGNRVLDDTTMPSRREAHQRARELALQNGLDLYQVEDRRSLGQSFKFQPVPPGTTSIPTELPWAEIRQRLTLPEPEEQDQDWISGLRGARQPR